MRDYGKVSPRFWTGRTGKRIRDQGRDAQVVALYLVTGPNANMLGLYYLPLPTLCHEVGGPPQGARKALRSLSEVGFAHYDEATEHVWIPEMARHQVGEALKVDDKRIAGIIKELDRLRNCRFVQEFYAKYRQPFNLPDLPWLEASPESLASPFEVPPEVLRSQEQEHEQEQETEKENEKEQSPGAAAPSALVMNGHQENNGRAIVDMEGFARFWASYPRKTAKRAAERAWRQLHPATGLVDQIIAAVDVQKRGIALSGEPRFIPHPASWLNGRRWEDEPGNNGHVPRNRINEAWIGQPTGRVEL